MEQKRLIVAGLSALTAFTLWVAWTVPWYLGDDAYITLNYAQCLAEGKGFVYSHPPASLGTTTPLFTLLMAAFHVVLPSIQLDAIALVFSAMCWAAIPWLLVTCRRQWRLSLTDALATGAALVLFGNYFGLGMEAYLFGALLLVACTLVLAGRPVLAGLAVGLLFLTRGEGILLAGIIPIWLLGANRTKECDPRAVARPLAWMALGGALVVVPWLCYAGFTFGRVLPDTLAAKLAQTAAGAPAFLPKLLIRLTEWGSYLPGAPWLTWGYHMVAIIGLWRIVSARSPLLLPIAWALLYGLAYTAMGVPYYWWYELPLYQAWLLCVGMGVGALLAYTPKADSMAAARKRMASRTLAVLLLACMTGQTIHWATQSKGYKKAETYQAVCAWLSENAAEGAAIGSAEVGYLGYFLPNPIVDFLGLTSPANIPAIASGEMGRVIWESMPDYIVALDHDPAWQGVYAQERFEKAYAVAVEFEAPPPWERCLIYQRRPTSP